MKKYRIAMVFGILMMLVALGGMGIMIRNEIRAPQLGILIASVFAFGFGLCFGTLHLWERRTKRDRLGK